MLPPLRRRCRHPSRALFALLCCIMLDVGRASDRVDKGNVLTTYGCKFSRGLCRPDEVCVDDNLFGSCRDAVTLALSKDGRYHRTFMLDSHLRRLLEAVMRDLVRDGYSWRDARTQCIVSAVLDAYDDRQAAVRTEACDAFGHGSYGKAAADSAGGQASLADLVRYVADGYSNHDRQFSDRDYQRLSEPISSVASHNRWQQQVQAASDLSQHFANPPSSGRVPALSREELEALDLFLRLADADSTALEPSTGSQPLSEPVMAAASLQSSSPSGRLLSAHAQESLFDRGAKGQPLPDSAGRSTQRTTSRKIDEELVGRLLRDEIGVDELTPEEVLQLTVLIKALLKNAAEPTSLPAESTRAAASISGASQISGSTPAAAPNSANGPSMSEFIEEGMNYDAKSAGAHLDVSSIGTLSEQQPAFIGRGSKTSDKALPAADRSADESRLEAELVQAQSASDKDAEKRVEVPAAAAAAAAALLANEPYVDIVDPTYGWVKFDGSVDPQKAKSLVLFVAEQLGAGNSSVDEIWVKDDEVSFRTLPNYRNITATEIAKAIVDDRDELVSRAGSNVPEVLSSGIGRGESRLSVDEVEPLSEGVPGVASAVSIAAPRSKKLVLAMSVVGGVCVLAIVIIVALVYVIRKRRTYGSKQGKLAPHGLAGFDTGSGDSLLARGEYEQDLVRRDRARSQAGGSGDASRRSASAGGADGSTSAGGLGREQAADDYSSQHSGSVSSWGEEPASANMDVTTGHMVLSYMEDHLKDKERLDREWQDLCSYEADPSATEAASLPKNRKKNRHLTVLPYDHNRVVLDEANNVASEDYINASLIVDHDPRSPAYIATQGPLVHTVADFWQMVWEQGCVVIAMLTRLSEGSVAMCHRYWPHDSSELYHIYEVHLVSEHVWSDDYLVRSFYLKNLETNETRTVTQFHYLAWPEGGVPAASKSLLDFRRKVNKSYRGRSRPVIVVCSDGAGRSGSFILLDMVINRMNKGAKEIDIAATLEFLRDQRACMVKTREQFEFVLTSVAEEVQAVLKSAVPQ